jgi:hypothetical protein
MNDLIRDNVMNATAFLIYFFVVVGCLAGLRLGWALLTFITRLVLKCVDLLAAGPYGREAGR